MGGVWRTYGGRQRCWKVSIFVKKSKSEMIRLIIHRCSACWSSPFGWYYPVFPLINTRKKMIEFPDIFPWFIPFVWFWTQQMLDACVITSFKRRQRYQNLARLRGSSREMRWLHFCSPNLVNRWKIQLHSVPKCTFFFSLNCHFESSSVGVFLKARLFPQACKISSGRQPQHEI